MSTDKTLADVQPGGRVRLGDQAERARFEAWLATQHDQGSEHVTATVSATDDRYQSPVTSSMWSAWQAANAAREGGRINGWRVIDGIRVYSAYAHASILDDQQYVRYEDYLAALSAQPSPGGQRDDSPMAKMAAALRGKAEAERAAFDQRVQSGEWGPMPDNPDVLELPPLPEEVDSVRCMIRGEKAFAEPCDYYFTSKQMRDYARTALAASQPVGATGKNSLTVGGGQEPVAYLDLGEGGYMDVGTDLSDEELAALPKGRHMLGIIGTYGVDGYKPAQAVDHEVTDAMVDKAWNRFEAALHADDGDTPEDRVLSETIDQRDRYHEMADELAGHIARIIGVDIGEHSSANCPWQNAIEAAEEYKPAQAVDLGPVHAALQAAARSLRTIADSTKDTEFLETASEIRAYANSRANCAEQALIDSQAVGNG